MKTKEIIEILLADASKESFERIVDSLIEDAKLMIKVRNAKQESAQRSCYMEQDQKWRSAYAKLATSNPEVLAVYTADSMLDALNSSKKISSSVMHADGVTPRFREAEQKHATHEAKQKLAGMISQVFSKVMEEVGKSPRISASTDESRKITAATRATIRYLSGEIVSSHTKTAELTREDAAQLVVLFSESLDIARSTTLAHLSDYDVSIDNVLEVFKTIPEIKEAMLPMLPKLPSLHELAAMLGVGMNSAQEIKPANWADAKTHIRN